MLNIAVVTLFPEMFDALTQHGVTGRSIERKLLGLSLVNPRTFTNDKHGQVDDRPYGGGPGMVMMMEPVRSAIRSAREGLGSKASTILLSPQGKRLDQQAVGRFAAGGPLILVCGRYEGLDERLIESEIDEEWSIGDFVMSGGELAAMALIDAIIRQLPGALGHADSAQQDSFMDGLLDCEHYTRPECMDGRSVPAVLLGGDHGAIRRWRAKQALGRTWLRRPDLLGTKRLDNEQQELLREFQREHGEAARDKRRV